MTFFRNLKEASVEIGAVVGVMIVAAIPLILAMLAVKHWHWSLGVLAPILLVEIVVITAVMSTIDECE